MSARAADSKASATPEAAPLAARPTLTPARGLTLHRRCACGGDAGHGASCESCATKNPPLQRRGDGGSSAGIPSSVHQTLAQPGRPLDSGTRSTMESRFGEDFSAVRIHDDSHAAQSARDVHAHAYTVGESIVFAPGQYQPHSESGQHLLAHELAHTVQQKGLQRSGISNLADQGPEYRRLESEADRAADFAMSGGGAFGHGLNAASRPTLSRTESTGHEEDGVDVPVVAQSTQLGRHTHNVAQVGGFERSSRTLQAFTVDPLLVPKSKGPNAQTRYSAIAGNALQATIAMSGRTVRETALWQNRPPTVDLRGRWLQAVSWPAGQATTNWHALGGDTEFPKCGGRTCEMDHIVELQLGGNNTNENIQALDRAQNGNSGSAVRAHVSALATAIQQNRDLTDGTANEIQLRFTRVQFEGTESFPDFEVIDQGANTCLGVEFRARNPTHPSAAAAAATVVREVRPTTTEDFAISAGGARTTLQVTQGFSGDQNAADEEIETSPANRSASTLIPGMILKTLKRNPMEILAKIDAAPTRIPLTLARNEATIHLAVDAAHELTLTGGSRPNIEFTYPYLSPGMITQMEMRPDGGINWTGEIRSRVPLVPRPLLVRYRDDVLSLAVPIDARQLGNAIPGFRVTEAAIELQLSPTLSASGHLAFALGSGARPIATGTVDVGADSSGLTAQGQILFNIPGIDETSGTINYRDGAWTGQIVIESTQIRIPNVTRGRFQLDIDREGVTPSGEVDLLLPRNLGTATLGISRTREGNFVYTGRGTLRVPGLREVEITGRYDGTTLTASANNIGFTWNGLNGSIDVTYTQRGDAPGRITGTGRLTIQRGGARGSVTVTLNDSGRFSGTGSIDYPITVRGRRIDAHAEVTIDEAQNVRVAGALRLPEPIQLFESFGSERRLFTFSRGFPVPPLSIGPLGVQAVVEASLSAGYSFGPGQLRNVVLEAAFNPLAEHIDPSLHFHCDLHIPASANIQATIGGGLRLEAGLGRVQGTLSITARLSLDAVAGGPLDVTYENQVFSVTARPGIDAALNLGLSLDANAVAEIGIAPLSASIEKTWNLGRRNVTLGQFSVHAPISYSSATGFNIPSMDQLEWGPMPEIDVPNLVEQLVSGSARTERETPA